MLLALRELRQTRATGKTGYDSRAVTESPFHITLKITSPSRGSPIAQSHCAKASSVSTTPVDTTEAFRSKDDSEMLNTGTKSYHPYRRRVRQRACIFCRVRKRECNGNITPCMSCIQYADRAWKGTSSLSADDFCARNVWGLVHRYEVLSVSNPELLPSQILASAAPELTIFGHAENRVFFLVMIYKSCFRESMLEPGFKFEDLGYHGAFRRGLNLISQSLATGMKYGTSEFADFESILRTGLLKHAQKKKITKTA
ncbi:hypothetical protein PG996_013859 [Apiospora saccharicola]|uniref:Zn(2)-C6 fungal-type domain-containing protein n=1 Tax=Apiospora saccharicola TaxID=335842 RepID=A0ABR1TGN7_9PEZI